MLESQTTPEVEETTLASAAAEANAVIQTTPELEETTLASAAAEAHAAAKVAGAAWREALVQSTEAMQRRDRLGQAAHAAAFLAMAADDALAIHRGKGKGKQQRDDGPY